MKNLFEYLKYIGFYFLFTIILALIMSLFNIININTSNIIIILNIIIFIFINILAVQDTSEKGIKRGIKIGLITTIIMFLINLIIFKNNISFAQIIYYIILIFCGTLGGSLGKNIKIKNPFKKRNLRQ